MFLNCSTRFRQHTAHRQELKNCNCSLCFYIRLWLPAAAIAEPSQRPATINVCKTKGCNYSFKLLMVGGVSPETCWAIKKHWNNKFYYMVASCWFFLWDLSVFLSDVNFLGNILQCCLYCILTLWIFCLHGVRFLVPCIFSKALSLPQYQYWNQFFF